MKKTLLFVSAAAACILASAQTNLQPQVFEGECVSRISPNGQWISNQNSDFGLITVTNLVTGQKFTYEATDEGDNMFLAGLGNNLSNTGVVTGTGDFSSSVAGYGENGVWHVLPIKDDDKGMCSAHAVSADGNVICGNVGGVAFGADDGSIMVHPVIWTRQSDGTFALYQDLPYPTKDFLGQTPQYVTAVCISGDGKTVAGQVVSNSGMFTEPIVYTQGADGKWTYTIVNRNELFFPGGVEYPEYPAGEPTFPELEDYATEAELAAYAAAVEEYNNYQATSPEMTDFMSAEEKAAYEAAVENWDPNESPWPPSAEEFMTAEELEAYNNAVDEFWANYPDYPSLRNYMTEDELAAYDAAEEAAYAAADEWYEKFDEYSTLLDELTAEVPHFIFNNIVLSNNGRYMAMSAQMPARFWGAPTEPAIVYAFDLTANTYSAHKASQDLDLLVAYIADNSQMLAAGPAGTRVRNAYLSRSWSDGEGFVALYDFVKDQDSSLYTWMTENMCHTYESEELDQETWDVVTVEHVDAWLTGNPYGTPDLSVIVTWEDNLWDFESADLGNWIYSYILPMDNVDGQAAIAASELGIKAARGGKVAFNGAVKNVVIYDINGREVYNCDAPASEIATGLGQGLYLIKATDAAGRTATAKAAF